MKEWLKLIRIHQWAKNLILFVPLVTSHRILEPGPFWATVTSCFAFSFVASATYIFNDLMDLAHDRQHRRKRHRPLAAGSIGVVTGKGAAILLGMAGLAISFFLPMEFVTCLGVYVILSLLYSLEIKKIPLADVTFLSGLYTLRILAGRYAAKIECSVWLLVFAIFIFFSLAMSKRYAELYGKKAGVLKKKILGRGYTPQDSSVILAFGAASGLLGVLVLVLYVNSPEVKILYRNPLLLLLLAPIFMFWVGRIWLLAARGKLSEDPVLFALGDKLSYVLLAASSIIMWVAT